MKTLTKLWLWLSAFLIVWLLGDFETASGLFAMIAFFALIIAGRANPDLNVGESLKGLSRPLAADARSLAGSLRSVRTAKVRLWILLTMTVMAALALIFPPWVVTTHLGVVILDRPLGYGTVFSPPDGLYRHSAHIDYGHVALEIALVVVFGAVGILLTHILPARNIQPPADADSAPLAQRVLEASGKAIVAGYRHIASQNGCAPTQSTSDDQILQIYRKVGTAFRAVAEERGEHLTAGPINTVVLKFLQVREKMGDAFVDEHLSYELAKYRKEGLRPEYQRDLDLI